MREVLSVDRVVLGLLARERARSKRLRAVRASPSEKADR